MCDTHFKTFVLIHWFSLVLSWFDNTENSRVTHEVSSEKGSRPMEELSNWAIPDYVKILCGWRNFFQIIFYEWESIELLKYTTIKGFPQRLLSMNNFNVREEQKHFFVTNYESVSVIFQILKRFEKKKGFVSDETFHCIAPYYICYHFILLYCFYCAMLFYCITLFHYNKAEIILLTLDFDVVCDVWACAQLSLDLAGEVQQLQEVVHSQLFPDNNTHTIKYSSCIWVWP